MNTSSSSLVGALRDQRVRQRAIQLAVLLGLGALGAWLALNAAHNLQRSGVASGFGFLGDRANFDISFTLIDYSPKDTYARAFTVGLLNTLLVSLSGIVAATVLGFLLGIGRLSRNWLIARGAGAVIETVRNLPLLLQLLFWYTAILAPLPRPKDAISLAGIAFLSNRGLTLPRALPQPGFAWVAAAAATALLAAIAVLVWAARRRRLSGQRFPSGRVATALLVGLPGIALLATGMPLDWDIPQLGAFNFSGGVTLGPELIALWLALTLYTGAFIGETVRAGILSVPHGQIEAARAVGLSRRQALWQVVIPQALRVIIPPMTTQHLTLIKNSSLAVVIGFPDLVAVFAGTALNQTGQAVEIIAITMAVYLSISLPIAWLMNWYNRRVALVQR